VLPNRSRKTRSKEKTKDESCYGLFEGSLLDSKVLLQGVVFLGKQGFVSGLLGRRWEETKLDHHGVEDGHKASLSRNRLTGGSLGG